MNDRKISIEGGLSLKTATDFAAYRRALIAHGGKSPEQAARIVRGLIVAMRRQARADAKADKTYKGALCNMDQRTARENRDALIRGNAFSATADTQIARIRG